MDRRGMAVAVIAAALAALALPAAALAVGPGTRADGPRAFDTRTTLQAQRVLAQRQQQLVAHPPAGLASLRRELGEQGVVQLDALTATPRFVGRLDGFLTGPSSRPASAIALDYVRAHAGVFGLSAAELAQLTLSREYVSIDGTRHLTWLQSANGVPLFGNGLKASVTARGELVNVLGSPVANLRAPRISPTLAAGTAVGAALRDAGGTLLPVTSTVAADAVRTTRFASGDQASLVLFHDLAGTHLGWQVTAHVDEAHAYVDVIDAGSGSVLHRQSIVDHATGLAWDWYPGAPIGGQQQQRNFTAAGWLPSGAQTLSGNNAHVYVDRNDDNVNNPRYEEVPPSDGTNWNYVFTPFSNAINPLCSAAFPCSWNPNEAWSWQVNRKQNATQVFFTVNKYHDYLAQAPIGFTEAAGNFQVRNSSGQGQGGDPLEAQPDDGANTADGLPDGNHIDNANMGTPPDGQSPTMQMYLFHFPGATNDQDGVLPSNGGDETDIVYHEYTHGLSSRLVVNVNGVQALNGAQPGAMGEAWSDFYALDLLVAEGIYPDTPAPGEVGTGSTCSAPPAPRSAASRWTARWLRARRAAPARPSQAVAATPTVTSGSSAASPRCTPTARSGWRRCGTCARRSVARRRCRSSPAGWSSRRPSRRCSTCATRSCRPTRSSTGAPIAASSGASSPTVAWASSPRPTMAPTRSRSRASTCRPARARRAAASAAGSPTATPAGRWTRWCTSAATSPACPTPTSAIRPTPTAATASAASPSAPIRRSRRSRRATTAASRPWR